LLEETMKLRRLEATQMRLISRHRHHHRAKAPRIAISQAEITADLNYPAGSHPSRQAGAARQAGRR
jgi:hypothetical protein